jgi:radical SAM protein with 4Fe4S-binding SPASM domain
LFAQAFTIDSTLDPSLRRLPLATLYLSERCNSRCVSCDYWRHGRADMSLDAVKGLLPSLKSLHTEVILLSGGEPLLNPEWASIARLLRDQGLKVWLLTSGLALAKHAHRARGLVHAITVSLDGTDRETYARIRGLDALENVCNGVRAAVALGIAPNLRVTLQRANFRQLPSFVAMAKELGARQVSFLAVDVANPHAFGRTDNFTADLALRPEDLSVFDELLRSMESDFQEDFRSGFIAESPHKLRRILQYFAAIHGSAEFPEVRCNAPEFSAVIGPTGQVQPCFFISGPADARMKTGAGEIETDLADTLNGKKMVALRADIRDGKRTECRTCVCSMWRDLAPVADRASRDGKFELGTSR